MKKADKDAIKGVTIGIAIGLPLVYWIWTADCSRKGLYFDCPSPVATEQYHSDRAGVAWVLYHCGDGSQIRVETPIRKAKK